MLRGDACPQGGVRRAQGLPVGRCGPGSHLGLLQPESELGCPESQLPGQWGRCGGGAGHPPPLFCRHLSGVRGETRLQEALRV